MYSLLTASKHHLLLSEIATYHVLMIERRAVIVRLEPILEQMRLLGRFLGCRRYVWNRALAIQLQRLNDGLTLLTYCQLAKLLTEWRNDEETGWLADAPVHTQQATLKDLDLAFQRWRKGTSRRPRFKKRGTGESIRYPDQKQIKFDFTTHDADGRSLLPRIFLPKLGWVKFRQSQDIPGKVCNVTVSYKAGHYYAAIQVEIEISPQVIPRTDENTVGGDIGICHFLVLSDGTEIDKPVHIDRIEMRLAEAQRKLSRMTRGSKNHTKQKKRIQRLHRKVSCARRDFLHKASAKVSKNHVYVQLEDAKVSRMLQTSRSEQPEGQLFSPPDEWFHRRLLDIGWAMFLFYLDYKLRARGGQLILVNPAYTSQECSECGSIAKANRPTQALFHCQSCHHEEHADHNAAKVIKKREGPSRFAHGEPSHGQPSREGQTEKCGNNALASQ